MNNITERLEQFIEYKGLNSLSLSVLLGYNSSEKISRLFRKENAKPSYDIIYDISNLFEELNIEWLINGKGQMLKTVTKHKEKNQKVSVPNSVANSVSNQNDILQNDSRICQSLKEENAYLRGKVDILKEMVESLQQKLNTKEKANKTA